MAKKKGKMFAGRTARSMEKTKTNYGYLKLPADLNVFKPEGGTEVVFDIVPYLVTDPNHLDNKKYNEDAVVGEYWWKKPIKVHRGIGPEDVTIVCPTTVGKKCPICEYGSKRRKAGADWDELKEIFPKNRTLFLIVPLDTEDCDVDYAEGEVHVLDQSDHLFLEYLEEEVSRDIESENFPDPFDGLSLKVYFRSKKLGKNKYAETSKIDFEDRDEQYDEEFLSSLPHLDDLVEIMEYKEIEALYLGMSEMEEGEMDDEELQGEPPPRKKRTSRKERGTRSTHRRDEDEPEDDGSEDDGSEEAPVRKRTSAKTSRTRKPKEEEEPEDPPTRKRSTSKPKSTKKECPYGHEFGVDTDEFDDCDRCKIWESCKREKEGK
jgi:hypothetical protein